MTVFDHYVGQKIKEIIRIDSEEDYEFFHPLGIFLKFNENEGLFFVVRGPKAIDIRTSNYQELYDDYGVEYSESIINDLKTDDELNKLKGEKIKGLKIGCYNNKEIKGDNFVISNGKYSGLIIETENHFIVFYAEFGGHLSVDDEVDIPDSERWSWS